MAENGVRTPDLSQAVLLDELLGHRDGSTVRAPVASLAAQIDEIKPRFGAVANLLADTGPSRGVGAIWEAGGFRYQEAASGATDHHVTTAGGVKLYAISSGGCICPEQFGTASGGTGNDLALLEAAHDFAQAQKCAILAQGVYGLLTPWEVDSQNVMIRGINPTAHNQPRSGLQKLSGFTGLAALVVADGVNGITIEHFYVNGGDYAEPDGPGGYEAGHGIWLGKCSYATLREVQTQNHAGYGIVFNGCWILRTYGLTVRWNGTETDNTSGGIWWRNQDRENNNQEHFGLFCVGNSGRDLYADDGGEAQLRANAIHVFGGQIESSLADCEIEAGTLFDFHGTQFTATEEAPDPAFKLGDDDAANGVIVRFIGCYFAHNSTGPGFALATASNLKQLEITGCTWTRGTSSKFLDASGTPRANNDGDFPIINITGGWVAADQFSDPNQVVAVNGGNGVNAGYEPGTAGGFIRFDSREYDVPAQIVVNRSGGAGVNRIMEVGDGTDLDRVTLQNLRLSIEKLTAAPANPGQGDVALADRLTWDPKAIGSGGPYLVWWNGSAWKLLSEQ
ncbi:hypothetical protein SAMN05444336_112127 [Albimonas donghaensis]|uniref:Uncharacterized protein n=1 Tax=Albimonas donghaensis TaxID=356660 RepID=A0A1H3FHV7_9RHOB|nr:hypothetical protein [Albimonas donghaensis]SDX90601.1 hypothetical protein SAMN05444336_112127 [Albimonas donghaensis]